MPNRTAARRNRKAAAGRQALDGEALDLARKLADLGVPVFWARISGSKDSPSRDGWSRIGASSAEDEIARWVPPRALCAGMGNIFDGIDWDPRNDPDETGLNGLRELFEKYKPVVYLRIRTPSRGYHWWIASLGERGRSTNLPGVDYLGRGRLAFLPGTMRRAKDENGDCYGPKLPYEIIDANLDAPIEACDGLREILDTPHSGQRKSTGQAVRDMLGARPGKRNTSLTAGVFRLADAGLDAETIIQLAAPALREAGWKPRHGSIENDIRDILGRDKNAMSAEESRELEGIKEMRPRVTDDGAMRGMLNRIRNGEWLDSQEFPPLEYAVPGLLPAGVVVIAGKPFAGKGLLVLRFVLECARGGEVFGVKCEQRPSLYLALEDGDRRIQERCDGLLDGKPIPGPFEYITHVEPGKLVPLAGAWLKGHPDGIVVIDTLGKVMEKPARGESSYDRDYRIMGKLIDARKEYQESVLVVNTHTRKARADDFVEMVSGTNAITGAADTVLVLERKRGTAEGTLQITSRDLDEAQYALRLSRPHGWALDGDSLELAAMEAERRKSRLDERSQAIVDYVSGSLLTGAGIREVADACDLDYPTAKAYLARLADSGHIVRLQRGKYASYVRF